MTKITENTLEEFSIELMERLGYQYFYAPDIAPDGEKPERNLVIENGNNKRPDVILFVNGIPLVVIELKNPADENATIKSAFKSSYPIAIPSGKAIQDFKGIVNSAIEKIKFNQTQIRTLEKP